MSGVIPVASIPGGAPMAVTESGAGGAQAVTFTPLSQIIRGGQTSDTPTATSAHHMLVTIGLGLGAIVGLALLSRLKGVGEIILAILAVLFLLQLTGDLDA
jgi:hypothetical protein